MIEIEDMPGMGANLEQKRSSGDNVKIYKNHVPRACGKNVSSITRKEVFTLFPLRPKTL
jgi:hypothetical protein